MSFAERLLRRRKGLDDIVGFNGGTLQDQLDEDQVGQSPDRMSGVRSSQVPQPSMARQYMATAQPVQQQPQQPMVQPDLETRPRQVNPFQQRLMQGRQRIADPTTFDTEHLRELETKKAPRWERILNATAAGVASAAQGGAPIKPIPTRRERDIGVVENRLGRDVALDRDRLQKQSIQSQIGNREAAQQAAEERIAQGNTRLQQGQASLEQRGQRDHENNLLRTYNGQTDFDPDDPANAGFVAEWQKTFGYKPSKNVRGSQLAVVQGYKPDGTPMVSIINKGKGTGTEASGQLPATTEGQQNRAAAATRTRMAQDRQDQRALQRGQGGQKTSAAANRLARQLNDAISQEQNYYKNATKEQRTPATETGLRQKRENLWNQLFQTYPEQFETDEGGRVVPKAQAAPSASVQPAKSGRTIEGAINAFKNSQKRDPTADEINRMKAALGQ